MKFLQKLNFSQMKIFQLLKKSQMKIYISKMSIFFKGFIFKGLFIDQVIIIINKKNFKKVFTNIFFHYII